MGISQLKKAFPSKEFTIDGRLVGDIGEAIVYRDYNITLYEGLAKEPIRKITVLATAYRPLADFRNDPGRVLPGLRPQAGDVPVLAQAFARDFGPCRVRRFCTCGRQ